jgi:hypothetical protein
MTTLVRAPEQPRVRPSLICFSNKEPPMLRLVITGMALAVLGLTPSQTPCQEKPKDEATKLVDEPQAAVVLTRSGKRMKIILVSFDSKRIQYKVSNSEKNPRTSTAQSGYIQAVQIASGDTFAVNPKTTAFEPYDTATRSFIDATDHPKSDKTGAGLEERAAKNENPRHQTEKIVAEGVGATADEALKDAFRNAVRQVVGAVVDAEILVKNEDIISDKVLTYSDGFIPKYEQIGKKQDKGLFRIKIAADVERRSVVAKLRAAQVTVKEVDGSSLFAKAVTTAEAQKNATDLLKARLEELPPMLMATTISEPDFDREKSELVVTVAVRVDRKAYGTWLGKMAVALAKISLRHGATLVQATPSTYTPGIFVSENVPFIGPALSPKENGAWCLWLNTFNNGGHTTTKWNWYVLDTDIRDTLKCLQGRHVLTVAALDADGDLVTENQCRLEASQRGFISRARIPILWHTVIRSKDANETKYTDSHGDPLDVYFDWKAHGTIGADTLNVFISPYPFRVNGVGAGLGTLVYQSQLTQVVRLKVALEELKRIKKVTCKVGYTDDRAGTNSRRN